MKKCMMTIAICTVAACVSGQSLVNPDFEEPSGSPTEIHGWGTWGKGLFRVDESEWSPVAKGKAMLGYKHWEQRDQESAGIFQDAEGIKAGRSYKFSIRLYLDNPESGSLPESLELRLESKIDGEMSTVTFEKLEPQKMEKGKWLTVSLTGTAPQDNLRALVIVTPSKQPGGALKIDDVLIAEH